MPFLMHSPDNSKSKNILVAVRCLFRCLMKEVGCLCFKSFFLQQSGDENQTIRPNQQEPTWQSSTLVFMTPFMYSFSMVGDTPKLFPIQRISVRPSGYVTSTEPLRMTDHESSWSQKTISASFKNEKCHQNHNIKVNITLIRFIFVLTLSYSI